MLLQSQEVIKITRKVRVLHAASYGDKGDRVFSDADKGARKEKRLRRKAQHEYINHSQSHAPDVNKFLTIMGTEEDYAPIISFGWDQISRSNHRGEVVVVGNHKISPFTQGYVDLRQPEREGQLFRFVDDGGENLTMGNTIKKGAAPEGVTIFISGDSPFISDLNQKFRDPSIYEDAVVINLNCRELSDPEVDHTQHRNNGNWQRNWHLIVSDDSGEGIDENLAERVEEIRICLGQENDHPEKAVDKLGKEMNWLAFQDARVGEIKNAFYAARKSAAIIEKLKFAGFLAKSGRVKEIGEVLRSHPGLTADLLVKTIAKTGLSLLAKLGLPNYREIPALKYRIRLSELQELATAIIGDKVKITMKGAYDGMYGNIFPQQNPGDLADQDSWRDWMQLNLIFRYAEAHGGVSQIFPGWEEHKKYAAISREIAEAEDTRMMQKEYINYLFNQYEGLRGKEPFDKQGRLQNTLGISEKDVANGVKWLAHYVANQKKLEAMIRADSMSA